MPRLARGRGQRAQVVLGAELRVDRVVAAGGVADRPRGAGIAGRGGQRVVGALAVGEPDRVDRRQVDDVEAELGQPRQLRLDTAQPAPGAREHLIPGAEPGPQPVDLDRLRLVQGDPAVALLHRARRRAQLLAQRDVVLGAGGDGGVLELLRRRARSAPGWRRGGPGALGGGLQQDDRPRTARRERSCWPAATLRCELVAPGAEHVGPGLDRVLPAPWTVDRELARPAHTAEVGVDPVQLGLVPLLVVRARGSGRRRGSARGRRGTRRPPPSTRSPTQRLTG